MISQAMMKKLLISKRDLLTKQQFRTLQGQVKSGNVEGAYKGIVKLLGGV